jgi:YVTN family beta-propeller protein
MTRGRAVTGVALVVLLASLGTVRLGHAPPTVRTIPVGSVPLALAVDGQTRRVFVANFASATVSMLDASTGTVLTTTAVVPYPDTLAIAMKAGRVFVASGVVPMNPDRVDVLDARSGRLLRTVAVGRGTHAVAADERSGHVFVTNALDNSVSMVDARSAAVLRTIAVGPSPLAVTVDEHLGHAFVLNAGPRYHGYSSGYNTVNLLDTRSGAVLHTVSVGIGASALAVDARSGYAFVANSGDGTMSVLDARTGTVVHNVNLRLHPAALAVDARSGHVFVANAYDRSVSIVEARSGRVLRTLSVALNPWSIAVDQRADRVLVSTGGELWPSATPGRVQVLDGRTGRRLRTVAVGRGPAALTVDELSGHVFVANSYGTPAGPGGTSRLVAWSRQWLPAWGQQWLARLALPSHPSHIMAGSVSVLDVAR